MEGHGGKGVPIKAINVAVAIVAVVLINFCALYLYRRHHRQKMNQEMQFQVNSAVSQYFKLSSADNI
jgi:hypothetical protein